MTKPGHIEIRDNEIVFVYHELEKPDEITLLNLIEKYEGDEFKATNIYLEKVEKYEASKREAGVENVSWEKFDLVWGFVSTDLELSGTIVKHNQSCEAKVTDGKAIIIKIN